MKKLMFVAAVAAGMVAFGDAIESANIVGYIDTAMRQKYTLFVPQFDDVGADGLDIQKIKPSTEATGVTIQTFTDNAETDASFYYAPNGGNGAGWYTKARARASDWASKTFAKGEGFMIYMPSSGISLNISGEVKTSAYTLENVRAKYTLMGNFRPMAYDLQKIVPATEATGVTLQTFTDNAETDASYYYAPNGGNGAGWYTKARARASDWASKSFDPGEGFMIYLPTSMNVTFQAAQ